MVIQEHIPVGSKTTMRIGGVARYYAEVKTKDDIEEAVRFAQEKGLKLIPLGGGSNTIFADGEIDALVIRIQADGVNIEGNRVTVEAGKILASLINELAKENLDLSALTGIPGTVGGAIFGNAGQGPAGIWISSFVESVTVSMDGQWKILHKAECRFRYREGIFKDWAEEGNVPIIWSATLHVPSRPAAEVKEEVERLIKRRIETQPHIKTAGSCFKALPDGTPAWKLIDAAGLRGHRIGGIQISEKHANFLLNVERGTFDDALQIVHEIQKHVPQIAGVEMRFYGTSGEIVA